MLSAMMDKLINSYLHAFFHFSFFYDNVIAIRRIYKGERKEIEEKK